MLIPFGYKSIILFAIFPIVSVYFTILLGKWWNTIAYHGKFHHRLFLTITAFLVFSSLSFIYFGSIISFLIYISVLDVDPIFIHNFFIVIDFFIMIESLFVMITNATHAKLIMNNVHKDWTFGDAMIEIMEDISKNTEIFERLLDDDSDEPREAIEKVMALVLIMMFPTLILSVKIFKRHRNGKRKF